MRLLVTSLLLWQSCLAAGTANVMSVNGEPVSREEFLWFMEQERPAVFQYFYEHHRLVDGTNFWSTVRGGATPRTLLGKNTVQRVVREKVEQKVFLDFGLVTNIAYAALLDQLAAVNRERQAAAAQHEVLYGPVTYSQLMFYGNWKITLQMRAKEKFADEKLPITDRDLEKFYRANRKSFRSPEILSLEVFTLRQNPASPATNSADLKTAAREVLKLAKSGMDADRIPGVYSNSSPMVVTHERYDDLTRDRLGELFGDDVRFEQVVKLKSHRSLELTEAAGAIQIVRCETNSPAGYFPFERVKAQVRRRYVDTRYDEWITSLTKSARVSVNQTELDELLP